MYAAHPLTAYLLAAVHQGCGLRLVAHAQTNAPDPINVLTDAPAHVYSEGDGDSALDAWGAELLAWCDAVRSAPEEWLDKPALRQKARAATSPVSAGFVRLALARVEREFHVRPLIAITAGAPSSLVIDPSLLGRLDHAFGGVSGFVHAPAAAATVVPGLAQLQGDLQRYVAEVFAALDPAPSAARPTPQRRSVFISYAHDDGKAWRDRLEVHLKGLPQHLETEYWSDTRLQTGDQWRAEIGAAMERAACAVLVLTPNFMASSFINGDELPTLLRRRQTEGMHLLPILAVDCSWELHPWTKDLQVQCQSAPLRRLLAEGAGADDTELKNLATQIAIFLDQPSPDRSP